MVRNFDAVIERPDRPLGTHGDAGGPQVEIRALGAESEHEIGLSHAFSDLGMTKRTHVDSHVKRVIHRENSLRKHRGHHRRTDLLRESD